MERKGMRGALLAAALMVAVVATPAQAGKGGTPNSTAYKVNNIVVEDGAVTKTDGKGPYLAPQMTSYVMDRSVPDSQGVLDRLYFNLGASKTSRSLALADPASGKPFDRCEGATITFTSSTMPNWYNDLPVGGTTVGDGALQCFTDWNGAVQWMISYTNYPNECLELHRDGVKIWRVTASASCDSGMWHVQRGTVTQVVRGLGDESDPVDPALFTATWYQQ